MHTALRGSRLNETGLAVDLVDRCHARRVVRSAEAIDPKCKRDIIVPDRTGALVGAPACQPFLSSRCAYRRALMYSAPVKIRGSARGRRPVCFPAVCEPTGSSASIPQVNGYDTVFGIYRCTCSGSPGTRRASGPLSSPASSSASWQKPGAGTSSRAGSHAYKSDLPAPPPAIG